MIIRIKQREIDLLKKLKETEKLFTLNDIYLKLVELQHLQNVSTKMLSLQFLLSIKLKNKRTNKLNEAIEKVDLAKLIKDTSKELKVALYNLSTAIDEINPKNLIAGVPVEIDVIDKAPSLYQINCEDNKPPLVISINYKCGIKDITLYTSWKNPNPNVNDNNGCYRNYSRVVIVDSNQNNSIPCFTHKYLYLSFVSQHGNLIRVNAKFKSKENRLSQSSTVGNDNKTGLDNENTDLLLDKRIANTMMNTINEMRNVDDSNQEFHWTNQNKSKLNNLANDPLHFQAFSMVIDKVRERAISNKCRFQHDNFIKKNMYLIRYWNEYDHERRRKHQDSLQSNLETCLKRKELILRYKRERGDTIKRIKEQIKAEAAKKKKITNQIMAWRTIMTQHQAAIMIEKKFRTKLDKIKTQTIKLKVAITLFYRYKKRSKRIGPTMDIRKQKDINLSLSFLSSIMEAKKRTACDVIHGFFLKLASIQSITLKMIKTTFRFKKLANFCKENYQRNLDRRKDLLYLWETELANLMIRFRTSSNEAENKKEDLLLNISSQQRDEALRDYLDRCKLRHANLYYEWRKKFNEKHGIKYRNRLINNIS